MRAENNECGVYEKGFGGMYEFNREGTSKTDEFSKKKTGIGYLKWGLRGYIK